MYRTIRYADLSHTNHTTQDAKAACVAARAVIWWLFEGVLGDVIGLGAFYRPPFDYHFIALGAVRVKIYETITNGMSEIHLYDY